MFITIDPYYDINFYNEAKEALKNNNIPVKEYISIKTPFNWYFDLDREPMMVNYDKIDSSNERFIVNKVQTLRPNESYLLMRRGDSNTSTGVQKYIENQPLKESRESEYSVFFNAINKDQLQKITKELPVKIYYFGRYYNNIYKVALCNNKMILNYISRDSILLERNKNEYKELGRFEADLNYKIFKMKDHLQKYTETAYFENGFYYPVKIKSDRTDAVSLVL